MVTYFKEAKKLCLLAFPVLMANIAQNAMNFVDVIMAGGYSKIDLAAVGVASSIWVPAILFGLGLLLVLVPVVAQLMGANHASKIPFQVQQGIYLALLVSIPIMIVLYFSNVIISHMNVEPMLAEKVIGYLHAIMWSVPVYLLFLVLRGFSEGLSYTRPGMVIGIIGLIVNVPLNWIFVYGKFGMPELGGVGCGVATTIVYWLMFFSMLVYVTKSKHLNKYPLFAFWARPNIKVLLHLTKLGLPIALSLFLEVTLFVATALLIAPLGANVVAGHQIAISFSSLMYIFPLSVSVAVSIRVSYKLGKSDTHGALVATRTGIYSGLILSIGTACFTVLFREQIALIYQVKDAEVIRLAMELLFVAAIYQCADAIQVVAGGALRGYKEMNNILRISVVCYWFFAFPIGYSLALTDLIVPRLGAIGFWYGFIIGLTLAAIALGSRLKWIQNQPAEFQTQLACR